MNINVTEKTDSSGNQTGIISVSYSFAGKEYSTEFDIRSANNTRLINGLLDGFYRVIAEYIDNDRLQAAIEDNNDNT